MSERVGVRGSQEKAGARGLREGPEVECLVFRSRFQRVGGRTCRERQLRPTRGTRRRVGRHAESRYRGGAKGPRTLAEEYVRAVVDDDLLRWAQRSALPDGELLRAEVLLHALLPASLMSHLLTRLGRIIECFIV